MEWISVDDRLPEGGKEVLTWFQERPALLSRSNDHGWLWGSGDPMSQQFQDDISHWQPLPDPPKAD